jgi:hypothetical protein
VVPDGFLDGNPIELKPNTTSGIAAGQSQLQGYMKAIGSDYGFLYLYNTDGTYNVMVLTAGG